MILLLKLFVLLIAIEHLFILYVEMFSWDILGRKMFRSIEGDMFPKTKVMAANQGLYNGFLAAGLIWSALVANALWAQQIAIFFLACVIVAGIYGALTASKAIFIKQALPAIIALCLVLILG